MNTDFMQPYAMQNFKTDNNGKIFYTSFTGEQFIGYSESAYNELQNIANEAISKAEKYKQMLIDNGLLQEPISQDKINNQILEQLNNLSMQLTKLNNEVNEIKRGGKDEYNASVRNNKQPKSFASSKAGVEHSEQHAENNTRL